MFFVSSHVVMSSVPTAFGVAREKQSKTWSSSGPTAKRVGVCERKGSGTQLCVNLGGVTVRSIEARGKESVVGIGRSGCEGCS